MGRKHQKFSAIPPQEMAQALDQSLRLPGKGDYADHEYDPDCFCRFCQVRFFTLAPRYEGSPLSMVERNKEYEKASNFTFFRPNDGLNENG